MGEAVQTEASGPADAAAPAPAAVPTQAEALALLRGRVAATGAQAALVARVRATFSDIEEDTLAGGELPFDAACFSDVLALRLRLMAALEHPVQSDAAAVNTLLAEVDVALDRLRAAEPTGLPFVLERLHLTRDALVQDAVTLSERSTAGSAAPDAAAAAPPPRRAAAAPVGRLVAYSEQDVQAQRRHGRRRNVQLAAALVLVLASVGLYVRRASQESRPPPTVQGAPTSISVRQDSRGGLLVRSLQPGRLAPDALEWVATYERRGYARRSLGTDSLYLQPPPAAAVTSNR